jgi:arylsulfatase A-like enzyme
MAKVEALGLAERTIFIFTSDHGGLHVLEFPGTPATHNTPFRAGKGFLYEGGLRVPLLVRWPGKVTPGVNDTPVVLTDLMPTMLEWAALNPANVVGPLDGTSLLKMFMGLPLPPRPLFWHFPHYNEHPSSVPSSVIRRGPWKLIETFDPEGVELYNLADDLGETNNLAAAKPELAGELRRELDAWRKDVGAEMMRSNSDYDPGAELPKKGKNKA